MDALSLHARAGLFSSGEMNSTPMEGKPQQQQWFAANLPHGVTGAPCSGQGGRQEVCQAWWFRPTHSLAWQRDL